LSDSIRLYDNCDSRRGPVFIGRGALDRSLNNHFQKLPQESFMPQRAAMGDARKIMRINHEETKDTKK